MAVQVSGTGNKSVLSSSQASVIRRCQFISDHGSLVFVFNAEYCSVNLRCVPRVGTEQSAREEMARHS